MSSRSCTGPAAPLTYKTLTQIFPMLDGAGKRPINIILVNIPESYHEIKNFRWGTS